MLYFITTVITVGVVLIQQMAWGVYVEARRNYTISSCNVYHKSLLGRFDTFRDLFLFTSFHLIGVAMFESCKIFSILFTRKSLWNMMLVQLYYIHLFYDSLSHTYTM